MVRTLIAIVLHCRLLPCRRAVDHSHTVCLPVQLWEQLLFDSAIKERLLSYAASALLFADRGVAPAVVGINRVALLHGCAAPPLCSSRLVAVGSQLSRPEVDAFPLARLRV